MDYTNVFSGLPDANIPNNPFVSGMNQSIRQESMMPFLRNANIQSDLTTQKQGAEVGEFMSPQAVQMRQAQRTKDTTSANTETMMIPLRAGEEQSEQQATG